MPQLEWRGGRLSAEAAGAPGAKDVWSHSCGKSWQKIPHSSTYIENDRVFFYYAVSSRDDGTLFGDLDCRRLTIVVGHCDVTTVLC